MYFQPYLTLAKVTASKKNYILLFQVRLTCILEQTHCSKYDIFTLHCHVLFFQKSTTKTIKWKLSL